MSIALKKASEKSNSKNFLKKEEIMRIWTKILYSRSTVNNLNIISAQEKQSVARASCTGACISQGGWSMWLIYSVVSST
jgi:hypothetical protein